MLFVDVRGFTALSERLPPDEVVARLNRFYSLAAEAVFERDGTLDKMVGDQVMAFFGTPFRPEDHPERAVRAALDIVGGVEAMAEDEGSLHVGGGVGTGQAFAGNVGEGEVRDFTAIGDVVNTAARRSLASGSCGTPGGLSMWMSTSGSRAVGAPPQSCAARWLPG